MGDEGRSQEGQGAGESEEDGLFTVSPSYGGNPLPYPQEGEIGSGATPTFEPWEDMGGLFVHHQTTEQTLRELQRLSLLPG